MARRRLYIVSRQQRELYRQLRQYVAGPTTGVILYRRRAQRRSQETPIPLERRRRDRRVRDVSGMLQAMGWALVEDVTPDGLRPGDRILLHRFNPLLPRRLVGRGGVVVSVGRVRASVLFDGEPKARMVGLTDIARIGPPPPAP